MSDLSEAIARFRRLEAGVFDPYILKAIFMGGGMGSGKSWVAKQLFGEGKSFGLKLLSVDEIFERNIKKMGMSPKTAFTVPTQTAGFASKGHEVHDKAWYTMMNQRGHVVRGRLGLLIDGTAKDPAYILRGKKFLEDLGYDCSLVMVTTPLEMARKRNQSRGRTVPDHDLIASHEAVRRASQIYKQQFGKNYHEVKNASAFDLQSTKFKTEIQPQFHRTAMKILNKPLKNPKGWAWLRAETEGMPKHLVKKVAWIGKKGGR
jgi:predicted kinase